MHKQSNKDIQSSEVFPEGYNCYRKDRKDDTHGGVFELVPDKYLSTVPPEFRVNGGPVIDPRSPRLEVKIKN
jgi:hypothetical protein